MQQGQIPKYPKQIKKITNGTQYFYAEAEFNVRSMDKMMSDSVLDILADSKIGLFIFDTDKVDSCKYNIAAEDAFYIFKKSELCMMSESLKKDMPQAANDNANSLAYTVRIKSGTFSGKTPAEILIADPNQWQALQSQRAYLQGQTNPKYVASNKQQIDAISEALALLETGRLNASVVASSQVILFSEIKTPNIKKVDERGLTKVRQLAIRYLPGDNTPFQINILNCMAPPIQNALVGARMSEAQDKKLYQMKFTERQWFNFWKSCTDRVEDFEKLVASQHFQYYNKYRNAWQNQ